jgi:ABC-type multidrug transport system ATPase subunit
MQSTIVFKFKNKLKKISLYPKSKITLGREKDSNTIVIDNPLISRNHLEIGTDGNNIYITDLNSTNGTFLNGIKLKGNQKCIITLTDKVRVGNNEEICVIYIENNETINQSLNSFLSKKAEITIGRSSKCDIVINDDAVSRMHTKIFKVNNEIYVEDLRSTNGTFLNQTKIKTKTKVNSSDIIYIGLHAFSLNTASRDLSTESAIKTIQLKKVFKDGRIGLHPININISSKKIVALMGPSGCGKSTLLKALNGDSPASSGEVYIFGLELIKNYELLKQKIGYVPQDDIVHSELTVNETLYYAAKLRLADGALETLIQERITEILVSLNLNDSAIRSTKIKNLSGGQRKRISIAVELLNRPSILFLDEPTSSLDPETIEEFLKCLKDLCHHGTTVIMVTHKPEDLHYVDDIIFLGAKGYHIYAGSKNEFLTYFSKKNIIEVYSLLSSEKSAKEWNQKLPNNAQANQLEQSINIKKEISTSPVRQLFWQSRRYLNIKTNDLKNMLLLFLQPLIIAILIKLSFTHLIEKSSISGEKVGVLGAVFMIIISTIWFGVSNSAKEIVSEKAIFRRERMYNLYLSNYFLSKWIVLSIISFIQLSFFLLILKIAYGNELTNYMNSLLFLFFISNSAIILGLLLSAISESTDAVMTILPVALLSQIILAGIITPLQSKLTEFMSYFTLGRWGTEGFCRLQDTNGNTFFMKALDENLYNKNLAGLFDSLAENILFIILLNLVMIVIVFFSLKKIENTNS